MSMNSDQLVEWDNEKMFKSLINTMVVFLVFTEREMPGVVLLG